MKVHNLFVYDIKIIELPLTMREFFEIYLTTAHKLNRKNLTSNAIVVIVIGAILGWLGIMQFDQISLILAIGYWVSLSVAGYFTYTPTFYWGNKVLQRANVGLVWRFCCLTLIATMLMCFVILIIAGLFFGWAEVQMRDLPLLFLNTLLIGSIIHGLIITKYYIQFQNDSITQKRKCAPALSPAPQIIQKLPLKLQGELLCLESEDHYLKIYTDKGQHMQLMRLKDAINELSDYPGLQTHRSWWVAESAISESIKVGNKTFLILKNDVKVPISRTYLPHVKQRNLI